MRSNRAPLYPWYRIAWNILWLIPVVVTAAAFLVVVVCAYGPRCARRIYDDLGC
jgi:hypothetical protein